MKKIGLVVFSFVVAIGLLIGGPSMAKANYLIDFGTGNVAPGGSISVDGKTGSLIPIGYMTVKDTLSKDGGYVVSNGYLDYSIASNGTGTISVWGSISSLGIGATGAVELLDGTITKSSVTTQPYTIIVSASGTDSKNVELLRELGIAPSTQFAFTSFFSVGYGTGATAYTPVSTDITNVGTPVPVPPSALLLVPGLLGLVGIRKRIKG